MFGDQIDTYEKTKEKTGSSDRKIPARRSRVFAQRKSWAEEAKLAVLADQIGVDMKKAPEEEKRSLLNFFKRSKFAQFIKKRK